MITAISWPTTLTIRHSRFATLTLAKLVASLALHPPVSATEADYAPQGEAFAEDDLLNCRSLPRLIPAPNHAPPWHADRRSAQGWRSQTIGEKGRSARAELAPDRAVQVFPCHGGGAAVPPSSFISLTFTSQRSLLWYFLGLQESTVPLRPFPVFPAYAISSISYSRVPMPSFSPCSRPACQLVSGNSAVK